MNIHEYQAKEILKSFGVAVPAGRMAETAEAARRAAEDLGGEVWAVKAQIHAGGRGKGGGVRIAHSLEEVENFADDILGMQLITHQTGPAGKKVLKVYIEEGSDIADEYYLGMVLDRATGRVTIIASSEGGVEIEEVAAKSPGKIVREAIDPAVGLQGYQARKVAFALGLPSDSVRSATKFISGLYQVFIARDCSLAEINPLIRTRDGVIMALDAKMNFDDNALFRHPDLEDLRDLSEEDPRESKAKEIGLSYVSLDGNIGCLVNGAGLAMATMDIIKHYGAAPANFLDVGGSANKDQIAEAFRLIVADDRVEAILINIFGGILRCDLLAEGIVEAAHTVELKIPLVVRMRGTNEDAGRAILDKSGIRVTSAMTMAEAAERVVAAARSAAS